MADSATQVAETKTIQPKANAENSSSSVGGTAVVEDNRPETAQSRVLQAIANSAGTSPSPNGKDDPAPSIESGTTLNEEFDISEIPEDYNPDKYNLDAEKKIEPNSKEHKDKLAAHEKSGAEMGKSAQIELAGELTYAARFNRFIGKESTYSILQRKAEEFNKETDVVKKQLLLKDLKPLAQTWLEKHDIAQASGDKEDANEKLKRESIYKFLNQSTSNYPEVMKVYKNVENAMKDFEAAPVEKRSSFHQAVLEYKKVDDLMAKYKSTYPPAINLLYFSEIHKLKEADNAITKSGKINGNEFDTELGFSIKETSVSFNLIDDTIQFSGKLNFTMASLTKAEGEVKVTFNSDASFKNIEIPDGKFEMSYNGIDLDINSFTYNFAANKFSVKEAKGSVSIFEKEFTVNATNLSVTNKVIDFETITGTLPAVDVGFFGIKETTITYNKNERELTGKTQYNFNAEGIPNLKAISTKGDLEIHWNLDDAAKRYYEITNGALSFKLYDQSVEAKGVSYNSKESDIKSENLDLTLKVPDIGEKTLSGKGIKINKEGLNFNEIKTKADTDPIKYSVLSIAPTEYILNKDTEGYGFKVAGEVKLTLPDFLGIKSDAKIMGNLGVNLSNLGSPTYDIGTAAMKFTAANPLSELSSLLGDKATKGRYELVGGFPIFPGVNAEFGAYLEYGADFGKTITASISWNKEAEELVVDVDVKDFEAKVGAGILAGIGLGLSLIAALQVRLKAGAAIDVKGALGYKKEYKLKGATTAKGFESLGGGLTYKLGGGLNMVAFLEIVATALYFFQKSFDIEIASKELGSFEISDKDKIKFTEAKSALASKEQLEKHIDEDKKEEYKKSPYDVMGLLSMDFTKRFEKEDKSNVIESFETDEKNRKEAYVNIRKGEKENKKETFSFYDTPIIDLQNFDDFMNKRCSWDGIHQVIKELGETLKPKGAIVEAEDGKTLTADGKDYLDNKILPNLDHLGKSSNMADAFVSHYEKKIEYFKEKYVTKRDYQAEGLKEYIELLDKKLMIFRETNSIKRYIHSQRKGDEKQQQEQVVTSGWFLGRGESNYEAFSKAYSDFVQVMKNQNKTFEAAELRGKSVKENLIAAHKAGRFKK